MAESLRILRGADLLVVAGGGQLDDYWGGAWAHPWALLKWACLARMARTPFVLLSVGWGTAPSRLSVMLLRIASRLAAYQSFRDVHSASVARQRLSAHNPTFAPDLAFGLPVQERRRAAPGTPLVVAVSPIAFADPRSWPVKDAALYTEYLDSLAEFVRWLEGQGHRLIFFCTDDVDVRTLRDLHERLGSSDSIVESDADRPAPYYKDVNELMEQLDRADIVVASRLHGVLLAHTLAKPVLAISYDWKVQTHMRQINQSEHVRDIRSVRAATLISAFESLSQRRTLEQATLRWFVDGYARLVYAQFSVIVERFLPRAEASRPIRPRSQAVFAGQPVLHMSAGQQLDVS